MLKNNDHVSNLHASVVDVVLDIDLATGKPQQPNKRVAENGIAKMADMCCFVGVDARMLDENFSAGNLGRRILISDERARQSYAVHTGIDVSRTRDLQLFKALDRADTRDNLLGDLSRRLT